MAARNRDSKLLEISMPQDSNSSTLLISLAVRTLFPAIVPHRSFDLSWQALTPLVFCRSQLNRPTILRIEPLSGSDVSVVLAHPRGAIRLAWRCSPCDTDFSRVYKPLFHLPVTGSLSHSRAFLYCFTRCDPIDHRVSMPMPSIKSKETNSESGAVATPMVAHSGG